MQSAAQIQAFFDEATNTMTYLVSDPATRQAAVIDTVLDYDHRSGKVSTTSADQVLAAAAGQALEVAWILETHAHADHLSAAPYLKARTGARVAIGEHIRDVQAIFRPVFNLDDVSGDGGVVGEGDDVDDEGGFPESGVGGEWLFVPWHPEGDG